MTARPKKKNADYVLSIKWECGEDTDLWLRMMKLFDTCWNIELMQIVKQKAITNETKKMKPILKFIFRLADRICFEIDLLGYRLLIELYISKYKWKILMSIYKLKRWPTMYTWTHEKFTEVEQFVIRNSVQQTTPQTFATYLPVIRCVHYSLYVLFSVCSLFLCICYIPWFQI